MVSGRHVPYSSLTPRQAVEIQTRLCGKVRLRSDRRSWSTVAGVDTSVRDGRVFAAAVVFSFPALEILDRSTAVREIEFPYIPGLLAFREIPSLLEAMDGLSVRPDLLLVDGHGLAHPRRFGVACHLGVRLDLPSIGCGKSLLVGEHDAPGAARGSRSPLTHKGEIVGSAVRTRAGVRPIYVSIGHRIDLESAVRIVLQCSPKFRIPEPVREADRIAGETPWVPAR